MSYPLAPKQRPAKAHPSYAVMDIEASRWTKFLVVGYFDGTTYRHFTDWDEFFEHIQGGPSVIYAHFGGNYDFLFLLQEIVSRPKFGVPFEMLCRGPGILAFKCKIGTQVFEFKDSGAMLPFSLRTICESFGVEHLKGYIDYKKIKKVTAPLLRYLESDCRGLHEALARHFEWEWVRRAGVSITAAGQALKIFQLFISKKIYTLSDSADEFVRRSYAGGRTEIFRPFYKKKPGGQEIHCFDVNSLYPTVMRENDFPTAFRIETTERWRPGEMGFYHVDVEVPRGMWIPPLGIKLGVAGEDDEEGAGYQGELGSGGKFVFPTGRFTGYWSTVELEYAESLGCKILKIHRGMLFYNGGPIFKEFIDTFYRIRMNAKPRTIDNIQAKLYMNSLYGRTGLDREREGLMFDDMATSGIPLAFELETPRGTVRLLRYERRIESFSNVAIAAWVTSLARIHMHKLFMQCGRDLYYTDTDSLFTTMELPTGRELGELKHEYSADRAAFVLPKTYMIEDIKSKTESYSCEEQTSFEALSEKLKCSVAELKRLNPGIARFTRLRVGTEIRYPKTWKITMKGFNDRKVQHLQFEDFTAQLEGEVRLRATNPEKIAKMRTALAKGSFLRLLKEQPRAVRSSYNKRLVVKEGAEFTSEPLHIENGTFTNLPIPKRKGKGKK